MSQKRRSRDKCQQFWHSLRMKPEAWDNWTKDEKRHFAENLLFSARGHMLMNEALLVASAVARNQEAISNAEDLDMIREAMFFVDHSTARLLTLSTDQLNVDEE